MIESKVQGRNLTLNKKLFSAIIEGWKTLSACIYVRQFTICGLIPLVSKSTNMCSCGRVCLNTFTPCQALFALFMSLLDKFIQIQMMQTSLNSYSTRKCFKINHCCMEFGFTVSISHIDHLFHSQSLRIITGNHRGKQENQAITKQKKPKTSLWYEKNRWCYWLLLKNSSNSL